MKKVGRGSRAMHALPHAALTYLRVLTNLTECKERAKPLFPIGSRYRFFYYLALLRITLRDGSDLALRLFRSQK